MRLLPINHDVLEVASVERNEIPKSRPAAKTWFALVVEKKLT